MKTHELRPAKGATHAQKRLGRGIGSGHGKTSGKGHKGQNARSGGGVRYGLQPGGLGFIHRIPMRGFTNHFRKEYAVVNVYALNERFEDGAVVNAETLRQAGLVKKLYDGVKVLGEGELQKKLTVQATKVTKAAQLKIEAAGGSVEVM